MASRLETPMLSGLSAAATAKYLRVKLNSSGEYAIAGDEEFDGYNDSADVLAAGGKMAVRAVNAPGQQKAIAGGAISVGAICSTAAGGKVVTGTGGAVIVGRAASASGGDGDVVTLNPVLPKITYA